MARRVGLERVQVLDTAARLADASAPEPLTLQALASALGIQKPSLYNYIDGLPGLERQLSLRSHRLLSDELSQAAVGRTMDDAVEAIANSFRHFILQHPGIYTLSVRASRNRERADAEIAALEGQVLGVITRVLSSYHLEGEPLLHAVRGLRSFVHGFAMLEAAGGFGLPLSLDESFAYLVRMYIRGLRARSK